MMLSPPAREKPLRCTGRLLTASESSQSGDLCAIPYESELQMLLKFCMWLLVWFQ